ncbi:MAG: DUF72 domain-containing protein [Saprospiraceae bacterium]|jgi:uncharacterized protein YecE (DUF72 family)|nr:DUF72 domain-containing protein [Saprospiraceae bacterium]
MKFGKLADISNVQFKLPDTPVESQKLLSQFPKNIIQHFYIGCTGWSMKEWVGHVYPKGTKPKEFLKAYAKQFNTIELNTTHYRIPKKETIDKWYKETPADFHFCPKIPQTISHSRDLGFNSGQLPLFLASISGLKEKLGCCFIQLPPYFGKDRLQSIAQFMERWPSSIAIAFEVRHESWFNNPDDLLNLQTLLAKKNASLVITDVAGRRDVLHMQLSNPTTLIRFVGNGLHASDYTRIDNWIDCLKNWFENGLQKVYFFPHEPDNILAPELAEYVLQEVKKKIKIPVRGPSLKDTREGEQISLF